MAKQNFSEDDLKAKGYVETSPGNWERPNVIDRLQKPVAEYSAAIMGINAEVKKAKENIANDNSTFDSADNGRYTVPETTVIDGIKFNAGDIIPIVWTESLENKDRRMFFGNGVNIRLHGLTPGLNGAKGLMREAWQGRKKILNNYVVRLQALKIPSIHGPVKIIYIRHTSSFMDWDNACASFKKIGDALVKSKILENDNPKIIVEFVPKQIKCKRVDQHTEIIITFIKP